MPGDDLQCWNQSIPQELGQIDTAIFVNVGNNHPPFVEEIITYIWIPSSTIISIVSGGLEWET